MRMIFAASVLVTCLSGCAGLNKPDIADNQPLPKGEGILVTNVVTNLGDLSITLIDKTNVTVSSAVFDLKVGDNFRVITLPAGAYSWRGIYAQNRATEFRDKMDFTITAGQINYVGDLNLHIEPGSWKYKLDVVDNRAAAEQRVKGLYPNTYKSLKFSTNLTVDKRTP